MRSKCFASLVLGLVTTSTLTASAAPLFELSGRVALADGKVPSGTTVKLSVDLNRDGELSSFETLSGKVDASGNYQLSYELDPTDVDLEFLSFATKLVASFEARGFDALIDGSPLPLVVTVEREGYSSITRTFSSLMDAPRLDALLTPLEQIGCNDGVCRSPSGGLEISGFPGGTGIQRAYAKEYDPARNTTRFPGNFSDSNDNLLISSGFVEVDLRDESGKHVSELSSPVKVRFKANEASWKTMRDLEADSGRIEVPMYSFSEAKGQWVAEPDGVLEDAEGNLIGESELAAIKSGSYSGAVYIVFTTKHFSTFNCDAPVQERACVKGRIVDKKTGEAVAGVSVGVNGVSYTGTAGSMTVGADGRFATDLMKSELSDEDTDGNSKRGEIRTAQLSVSAEVGVYVGPEFESPTVEGSVGGDFPSCQPADCACQDLGDIEVEFEEPRACEITVRATYSGEGFGTATLEAGAGLDGASVSGQLLGGTGAPMGSSASICEAGNCYSGTANADGTTTFIVPVIGDAPKIDLSVTSTSVDDGDVHYYTGSLTVDGCARDQDKLGAVVELEADHVALGEMGSFIASLGDGPKVGGDNDLDHLGDDLADEAPGCGCSYVGAAGQVSALGAGLFGALGLWIRRRARR